MSAKLSRAEFFAAAALPLEEVDVPALGGTVFVRGMTGSERDRYEVAQAEAGRDDFRARLVAHTARDESGRLLFTEADVPALGALPVAVLEPIVEAAIRLSKFTKSDVEGLAKNSETGPSAGSPSA